MLPQPNANLGHMEEAMCINESQNGSHPIDVILNYLGLAFQLDTETVIYVVKKSISSHSMDMTFSMSYFCPPTDSFLYISTFLRHRSLDPISALVQVSTSKKPCSIKNPI